MDGWIAKYQLLCTLHNSYWGLAVASCSCLNMSSRETDTNPRGDQEYVLAEGGEEDALCDRVSSRFSHLRCDRPGRVVFDSI